MSTPSLEHVVATVLEVDPAEITDDAAQPNVASWTSMRHIQLVVSVQEAYGVTFDYAEISDIRSVADLRRALRDKGVGCLPGRP